MSASAITPEAQMSQQEDDAQVESIFRKRGSEWSLPERERVIDWVLERHVPRMLAIAITQLKNEHDAKDTLQDFFVKVLARTLSAYEPQKAAQSSPTALLYAQFRKVLADTARRLQCWRRDGETSTAPDASSLEEVSAGLDAPDVSAEWSELRNAIPQFLDQLPEMERKVVRLRVFDELGFQEIAGQCGFSVATAWRHWEKALDRMYGWAAK